MRILPAMYIITAMWIGFIVYWWPIAARNVKQNEIKEGAASRALNKVIIVAGAVLLCWPHWINRLKLNARFVQTGPGVEMGGVVVVIAGLLLALWARRHLGRNWSSTPALKIDHELVRSGPYAFLRHPIYVGLGIALAGTGLAEGVWRAVAGVLLICFAFWRKASLENAFLARRFGEETARR